MVFLYLNTKEGSQQQEAVLRFPKKNACKSAGVCTFVCLYIACIVSLLFVVMHLSTFCLAEAFCALFAKENF